jgi:glucose/mannose-6-phosphate isomerase
MSARLDFMRTLFEGTAAHVIEIHSKGKSRLAKMMYTMYLGDFVSCYLAVLRNIDPTPVDIIAELKKRLAEK